jgi:hypothetical protein
MRRSITSDEARRLLLDAPVIILDIDDGAFRFQLKDGRELLAEAVRAPESGDDVVTLWTLDGPETATQ